MTHIRHGTWSGSKAVSYPVIIPGYLSGAIRRSKFSPKVPQGPRSAGDISCPSRRVRLSPVTCYRAANTCGASPAVQLAVTVYVSGAAIEKLCAVQASQFTVAVSVSGAAIEKLCAVQAEAKTTDRATLVRAARCLLSSVTKVLLLADTVVVKQLILSKDKVSCERTMGRR